MNMSDGMTSRESVMAQMLRDTTVALGCELIKQAGEEAAVAVFAGMMKGRVQALQEAGALGTGFQVLADMVSKTASIFGQEVTFDVENMICRVTKCGLCESGRRMGYETTPLCIRCKANSDTVLEYVLPGYAKTIEKSLWWGDDECYMVYKKEK